MSATHEIKIDDAAIERVAQRLYLEWNGSWGSGHGLSPTGTPWGTSREKSIRHIYFLRAQAVIEALVGERS